MANSDNTKLLRSSAFCGDNLVDPAKKARDSEPGERQESYPSLNPEGGSI